MPLAIVDSFIDVVPLIASRSSFQRMPFEFLPVPYLFDGVEIASRHSLRCW